jgi:hypothetical protein
MPRPLPPRLLTTPLSFPNRAARHPLRQLREVGSKKLRLPTGLHPAQKKLPISLRQGVRWSRRKLAPSAPSAQRSMSLAVPDRAPPCSRQQARLLDLSSDASTSLRCILPASSQIQPIPPPRPRACNVLCCSSVPSQSHSSETRPQCLSPFVEQPHTDTLYSAESECASPLPTTFNSRNRHSLA